jgi:hypothetical protein
MHLCHRAFAMSPVSQGDGKQIIDPDSHDSQVDDYKPPWSYMSLREAQNKVTPASSTYTIHGLITQTLRNTCCSSPNSYVFDASRKNVRVTHHGEQQDSVTAHPQAVPSVTVVTPGSITENTVTGNTGVDTPRISALFMGLLTSVSRTDKQICTPTEQLIRSVQWVTTTPCKQ